MNIFREMKERVTARQVAERYGLKVSRNGMACCPFHNDKHPSMKIDQNYYCLRGERRCHKLCGGTVWIIPVRSSEEDQ